MGGKCPSRMCVCLLMFFEYRAINKTTWKTHDFECPGHVDFLFSGERRGKGQSKGRSRATMNLGRVWIKEKYS